MITLTEHDADDILKVIRRKRESLVSSYEQLDTTSKLLITIFGDDGQENFDKYKNEKKYYEKLAEYDRIIDLLTMGSEIK
jgi:hypothetical protein